MTVEIIADMLCPTLVLYFEKQTMKPVIVPEITFKGHSKSSFVRSPELSIKRPQKQTTLISRQEKWNDLESRSRPLVMAQFNRPNITFYYWSVITMSIVYRFWDTQCPTMAWHGLEIWVWGYQRSLEMAAFDRLCTTSYHSATVSTATRLINN